MKRPDGILVMAAVVVAVLLVGEFISYGPGTYVSESEVILDEDGYNIVLDTNYSTEYTVLVTETDANGEPRHLYIYRDFDYASFIEDSYLDYWIEKMAAEFEAYNFTDFTIIDAEGLRDMMAGSVYNGTASQTAVLFLTGILPDTVYGEDEDNLFQAWLSAGGFVYWSGAPIGMFVGHERTADTLFELVTDDPGDRFFGIPGSIRTQEANDMAQDHSSDRYIGEALNIYYDSCNYGVSSDVPDSLFIGYEKDGYNSIWDFAAGEYEISKSAASRYMAMNDRYSVDGNSPVVAEQYREFGKSQLQEMLYLTDEQLEEVTPDSTVAQIRKLRQPEEPPMEVEEQIPGQQDIETDYPEWCPGYQTGRTTGIWHANGKG